MRTARFSEVMRVPGTVQRLVALAAVVVGGGFFAASVDGVTQVGASLEAPAPQAVPVVDKRDCPDDRSHMRDL